MVWPGFDFPIQLLPQPQHWESEKERHSCLAAMKELPEGLLDDTNPPCLIYQSWFWSGLHTLALNWKKMLISNGKKEISLGVSNKDSMGISLAAHHNASEVYIHSLAPASLSQYLNPHQSGPWTWPVHNSTLMCVSAPGSGGTQGIPKPSESLRHSQHNPPQPGCKSTSNAAGTPVSSAWQEASFSRVQGAKRTTPNLWVVGVGSNQHTINPSSEPPPEVLELHLGPLQTLALSSGPLA